MDMAFLLDSSSSVSNDGYQTLKEFVGLISHSISMTPTGSRVGLISFSSQARLDITLQDHDNPSDLQSILRDLKFLGGTTRIDKALDRAFNDLFTLTAGARPGVPRVVVLFTDGKETNVTEYEALRSSVEPFKADGIAMIAVGIGPNADLQRLRVLVDSDELVLAAESFEKLSDLALNVTLLACKAAGKRIMCTKI